MKLQLLIINLFVLLLIFLGSAEAGSNRADWLKWRAEEQNQSNPQRGQESSSVLPTTEQDVGQTNYNPRYGAQHLDQSYNNEETTHSIHAVPVTPVWLGHGVRSNNRRMKGIVINEPHEQDTLPSSDHVETSDIDYEPDSPPIRHQATRKSKGKVVAAMTSFNDDETSDEENYGSPEDGHRLFSRLNVNVNTPQVRNAKPRKENSRRHKQDLNKEAFEKEWNRLGLGPEMTSKQLAEQVAVMRIPDMSPQTKGRLAKMIVFSYSNNGDQKFVDEFSMRLVNIYKYASRFKTKMLADEEFKEMDPDDVHYLAVERSIDYNNEKEAKRVAPRTKKPRHSDADDRMDVVGDYIIALLQQKDLNIKQMSLDELDKVVRKHGHIDEMSDLNFTDSYFRWLNKRMGIKKVEADLLRRRRKTAIKRPSIRGSSSRKQQDGGE